MIFPKTSVRSTAILFAAAILAMLPAQSTSASMLTIITPSPTLMPGQSETISVQFTYTGTQSLLLGSANIEISYDNTRFSVSNIQLGSLDPNSPPTGDYNINENMNYTTSGLIYAGIDSDQYQTTITTGTTGTLETFTLTALASAPLGGNLGDINLLRNGATTITNVTDQNNGPIVLTPAPTNGYDAGVDGTVVVGAAVPEPSSLILMGLGGGLVVLTSRFRKKTRRPSAA
jgi:hypothetical protein